MRYCDQCGTKITKGNFCPKCGNRIAPEENYQSQNNSTSRFPINKTWIIAGLGILAILAIVIFVRFNHTVNEPCDLCGNSPSVAYKLHDGSDYYICRDCSKKCFWCGKKSKKHYENAAGMIIFVCNDCYDEIVGE